MSLLNALAASGGGAPKLDASDVFSAYLTTGTGASLPVTTGLDLQTKGGAVFRKCRSAIADWAIYDTSRGITNDLVFNTTAAQTTQAQGLTAVSTTGHTWGTLAKVNTNGATYVDTVFIEAPKFFHQVQVVHTNGTPNTVDLSMLGTVGMVTVKSTVGTSNWFTWHRSLTAGNLTYLNLTNAQTADTTISVSGTTLTIASTAPSDTYIVYAWAHDTGTDGIIQCGSVTLDGSGNGSVTLGWEPQFLDFKSSSNTGHWYSSDNMRGFTAVPTAANYLILNASGAETGGLAVYPNATGFSIASSGAGLSYIYMAIRRPNKVPTSGTQVYNAIARTGTGAVATVSGVGFAPDLVIFADRLRLNSNDTITSDRLRGTSGTPTLLRTNTTAIEQIDNNYKDSITGFTSNGMTIGTDFLQYVNVLNTTYINHFFKRAKGFFDIVCYTATASINRRVAHNLGVVPELIINKQRSVASGWPVYFAPSGRSTYRYLNQATTDSTLANIWGSSDPTINDFGIDETSFLTNGATQVAYLFATLAGISKVGSYTGNGTSITINCGFTTGARFVLIKCTSTTGDWYVWDTARGIVAANDPHLSLNTTAAEVTTDDSIDPDATGFIVNQVAATNINVSLATYIYLAIS